MYRYFLLGWFLITEGGQMNAKQLAKHRAKFQHAVASPQEQARQLAALQALGLGLLGLGSSAGGVAIPGPLGGPGAALALYN